MKILFWILVMVSLSATGQVKIISTETFIGDNKNQTQPKINLGDLSAEDIDFIKNHFVSFRQISNSAQVIFINKSEFITTQIEGDKKIVSRHVQISGTNFQKLNDLKFTNSDIIIPFQGGGFAAIERWEGGGNKIQIFSKDFQLLNVHTLFLDGYDNIQVNAKDNLLLIGARSVNGGKPKLVLIDEGGTQIFTTTVSTEGDISKVLCSSKYFMIYCFNQVSLTHEILTYDKYGKLLWRKIIDGMVGDWICNESESPYLAIGFQRELIFIRLENSSIIQVIKLEDIYKESGISSNLKNHYIEIEGIGTYNKAETSVLVATPIGTNYENIILFTFNPFTGSKSNLINIGESKSKPIFKSSDSILTIIKNNEIIKYGF